jgi:hypothetical protein
MRAIFLAAFIALAAVQATSGQEIVHNTGDGVTLPRPTKEVRPEYTQAALTAGIEGLDTEYGLDPAGTRGCEAVGVPAGREGRHARGGAGPHRARVQAQVSRIIIS